MKYKNGWSPSPFLHPSGCPTPPRPPLTLRQRLEVDLAPVGGRGPRLSAPAPGSRRCGRGSASSRWPCDLLVVERWDSSSAWRGRQPLTPCRPWGLSPHARLPHSHSPAGNLRHPSGPHLSPHCGAPELPTSPARGSPPPYLVIVAELIVQDVSVGLVRLRPGRGDAVGGAAHLMHSRDWRELVRAT